MQEPELHRHQGMEAVAGQQREGHRAAEALPGFARANVRDHLVPADEAAGQVSAHVAELRHGDEVELVILTQQPPLG